MEKHYILYVINLFKFHTWKILMIKTKCPWNFDQKYFYPRKKKEFENVFKIMIKINVPRNFDKQNFSMGKNKNVFFRFWETYWHFWDSEMFHFFEIFNIFDIFIFSKFQDFPNVQYYRYFSDYHIFSKNKNWLHVITIL